MRMTLNISVIVCALAMLCGCGVKPATTAGSSQPAPAVRVPRFEADSAMAHVLAQCAFGPRVPGTPAHEQCGRWIRQQLERWADTVVVQQGQVSTFDGVPLTATNLVGVVNPGAKQRLLLLAHWDCRPWADADPDVSKRRQPVPLVVSCVAGALSYVVLYMLKTAIYGAIAGNIWAPVASKFPASIINAGAAIVATPIFYSAVRPALKASGVLKDLEWVKD